MMSMVFLLCVTGAYTVRAAVAAADGTHSIFGSVSAALPKTLARDWSHDFHVAAVALSPSKQYIAVSLTLETETATISQYETKVLYAANRTEVVAGLSLPGKVPYFQDEDLLLLLAADSKSVQQFDWRSATVTKTFEVEEPQNNAYLLEIAYANGQLYALSSGYPGIAYHWDANHENITVQSEIFGNLADYRKSGYWLAVSGNGHILAVGVDTGDNVGFKVVGTGDVAIDFNLPTGASAQALAFHNESVFAVGLMRGGVHVYQVQDDDWNQAANTTPQVVAPTTDGVILNMCWLDADKLVVATTNDVSVWHVPSATQLAATRIQMSSRARSKYRLHTLVCAGDGHSFIACGVDHRLTQYSLSDATEAVDN